MAIVDPVHHGIKCCRGKIRGEGFAGQLVVEVGDDLFAVNTDPTRRSFGILIHDCDDRSKVGKEMAEIYCDGGVYETDLFEGDIVAGDDLKVSANGFLTNGVEPGEHVVAHAIHVKDCYLKFRLYDTGGQAPALRNHMSRKQNRYAYHANQTLRMIKRSQHQYIVSETLRELHKYAKNCRDYEFIFHLNVLYRQTDKETAALTKTLPCDEGELTRLTAVTEALSLAMDVISRDERTFADRLGELSVKAYREYYIRRVKAPGDLARLHEKYHTETD